MDANLWSVDLGSAVASAAPLGSLADRNS